MFLQTFYNRKTGNLIKLFRRVAFVDALQMMFKMILVALSKVDFDYYLN